MELLQMGRRHASHVKKDAAGSRVKLLVFINQIPGKLGNGSRMPRFNMRFFDQEDFQPFLVEPNQHTIH